MNRIAKIQKFFLRVPIIDKHLLSTQQKKEMKNKGKRQYDEMLQKNSIEDRFSEIYEKNYWRSKESGSGEGSELGYTEPLRDWLINKIPTMNVNIFVDAPCGDFNWIRHVLPHLNVHYIGIDIVRTVIEHNQKNHSSSQVRFSVANICEETIPKCDLLMVRDCLFHLSYADIDKFLHNLSKTDYKYLLTTTHIVEENFSNVDIQTGDFRLIDLFSYPFFFDKDNVKDRVNDYPEGYPIAREMILIEKKFVPCAIQQDLETERFDNIDLQ